MVSRRCQLEGPLRGRVNRAKKFMCSPRNTGNIKFSLCPVLPFLVFLLSLFFFFSLFFLVFLLYFSLFFFAIFLVFFFSLFFCCIFLVFFAVFGGPPQLCLASHWVLHLHHVMYIFWEKIQCHQEPSPPPQPKQYQFNAKPPPKKNIHSP